MSLVKLLSSRFLNVDFNIDALCVYVTLGPRTREAVRILLVCRSDKLGHPIVSYTTTCRVVDGAESSRFSDPNITRTASVSMTIGFSETNNVRSYDAYGLCGEYTFTKRV